MEVMEFIKQKERMCDYHCGKACTHDDSGEICPAYNINCDTMTDQPEQLVAIVEQWAKEHPEKPEQEQQKPEQERQEPEHPEESSDLHAIIDALEYRIDKLDGKVSNEALIFREVSKRNQDAHRQLADRIAKLEQDNQDNAETMYKINKSNGGMMRRIVSHKERIEKLEYDVSVIRNNLAVLGDQIYALREKVDHTPTEEPSQTQEPKRTNKDVLLAAFPNARMDDNGIPDVCPLALDTQFDCNGFASCSLCKRTHWLKEDRVTQWRRRHKRCEFCRHIEYLSNPCGISAYKCRAKEKLVCEWLPRPFCGLYEVKIQKKEK